MQNKNNIEELINDLLIDYEEFTLIPFAPSYYYNLVEKKTTDKSINFKNTYHKISLELNNQLRNNNAYLDEIFTIFLNTYKNYISLINKYYNILDTSKVIKNTVTITLDDIKNITEKNKDIENVNDIMNKLKRSYKLHKKFNTSRRNITDDIQTDAQKKISKKNFEKNVDEYKDYINSSLKLLDDLDKRNVTNNFLYDYKVSITGNLKFLLNYMIKEVEYNLFYAEYNNKINGYMKYIEEWSKLIELDNKLYTNLIKRYKKIIINIINHYLMNNYAIHYINILIEQEIINKTLKILDNIYCLSKSIRNMENKNFKFFFKIDSSENNDNNSNYKKIIDILYKEIEILYTNRNISNSNFFNINYVNRKINTRDMGMEYNKNKLNIENIKEGKNIKKIKNIDSLMNLNRISNNKIKEFQTHIDINNNNSNDNININDSIIESNSIDYKNIKTNKKILKNYIDKVNMNIKMKFLYRIENFSNLELKEILKMKDKEINSFVLKTIASKFLCEADHTIYHLLFFEKMISKITAVKGSLYFLSYIKHFRNILNGIKSFYYPLKFSNEYQNIFNENINHKISNKNINVDVNEILVSDKLINIVSTIITISDMCRILNQIKNEQILLDDSEHNALYNDYKIFGEFLRKKYREKILSPIFFYLDLYITKNIDGYECEEKIKQNLYEIFESYRILKLWDRKQFRRNNKSSYKHENNPGDVYNIKTNKNILKDIFYEIDFVINYEQIHKKIEKKVYSDNTKKKIINTYKEISKQKAIKKLIKKVFNHYFDVYYMRYTFQTIITEFKNRMYKFKDENELKEFVKVFINIEQMIYIILPYVGGFNYIKVHFNESVGSFDKFLRDIIRDKEKYIQK